MPLSEYEAKEALRSATDWLVVADPPGSVAAREGISNVIPLVMMGEIVAQDLDELAALVEQHARDVHEPGVPVETHLAQLKTAIGAAFAHAKSTSGKASN